MKNQYLESIIFGCIIYLSTVKCRNTTGHGRKQVIVPFVEGHACCPFLSMLIFSNCPLKTPFCSHLSLPPRGNTTLHFFLPAKGVNPYCSKYHHSIIYIRHFLRSFDPFQGNFSNISYSLISSLYFTEGMLHSHSFNLDFI